MTEDSRKHAVLRRRTLLELAGGSAATAGLASLLDPAPAAATQTRPGEPLRFAAVTDTHVNVTSPQSTDRLAQVYAALAARGPEFVLHCGDITDTGLPDEYDQYDAVVPNALRGRIRHTPGNHDTRWDPTAKQLYQSHFGPAPYSFDAGGVHFVGFDPAQVLQEPGHAGPAGLAWLAADLRRRSPATPTVLFQHFPLGNAFYYVDDQPAVLDLLAQYNVRAILAGHIHREDISHFNGFTQVGLNAVLNAPVYYWFERSAAGDGTPILAVTRVTVAGDGSQTETPLATVPLAGPGQGRAQRPHQVRLGPVAAGALPVTVELAADAGSVQVGAQPYPQAVFGATSAPAWQLLAGAGDRWSGSVDISGLAPGEQRLQIRVQAADGGWWEETSLFAVPAGPADPQSHWQRPMPGAVQGGVAVAGRDRTLLVAGSTAGEVVALRPDGGRVWRAQTGPVYRQPGVDATGATVYVPAADHRLYALDTRTGRRRWSFDAGAPVLSAPALHRVDGREQLVFSAGQSLYALDAPTGRRLWSVAGRGFSAGRAAGDGERVYTSAADGYARAHDARTGDELWVYQMVAGVEHRTALYSGWDTVLALGDGLAIVVTVSSAIALDTVTGAVRWQVSGSTMYAPALILPDGTGVLTTEWGVVTRIELATGATIWSTNLALRVFNAGVLVHGDTVWVLSVDGKLIGVRLADGIRQGWFQHSLGYTFSRPAVTGGVLVVGDQNGVLHGIRLP